MKKIYLLLLLAAGFGNAQVVNIPDPVFKAALLSSNTSSQSVRDINNNNIALDANSDGEIQQSEALLAGYLSLSTLSTLADLTGLERFTNLKNITILSGSFTSIPIANLVNLEYLSIESTPLASLDISGLPHINRVNVNFNQLTSINTTGANTLVNLNCYNNQLTNLDVSNFTNLATLYCDHNLLTNLNMTGCTSLLSVDCSYNQLASVDVSGFTQLYSLEVVGAGLGTDPFLTSVNASGCSSLTAFSGDNHSLETLNLSGCSSLHVVSATNNLLNNVNIEGCSAMNNLFLDQNILTSLDVSDCVALTFINVDYNQLTTLDVSNCINLSSLFASDNLLTHIFAKNGKNESLYLGNLNPLQFICADESQIVSVGNSLALAGVTGVEVNSYCSFTPGGNFNTITGNIRLDADNNGCDAADAIPQYMRVTISDGTNNGATFIDTTGDYKFYTGAGNFLWAPTFENPDYFNCAPATSSVNFPLPNNLVHAQDFCVTSNGIHPDLEVVLMPRGNARSGFDASYIIVYKNKGNQTLSGSVTLNFDEAHTDFVLASPIVDSQSGGALQWNFTNLLPFQTRAIEFVLNVNSPVENPPVHNGDILNSTASITSSSSDDSPLDNVSELHQTVVNAYDPNDKTCLEGNTVTPENIGKYLHYNINFENTGTSDAVNVVVKDVIDTTKFDINSLQLLYASHPVETKITGNVVEFIFENINLPPSSLNPIGGHGNVLFKIKTLEGLPAGTEVSNTAGIYFDYNAPIATNTARTTFAALSKSDFKKDNSITVYPNPAKSNINIKAKSNIKTIQLFDIEGSILQTSIENKNVTSIDIANQQSGIYFLKIITADGSTTEKIIKE